jgi:hypothetical protein
VPATPRLRPGQGRAAALIDLSRNSIHRTPHYLGAYIQTLTLYALNSNDGYHIANLQKQVNSALSRIRDSLMMSEFNYPVFEQICQARVRIALGELLKGKKMLYRANQNWLDEPATMPPALLARPYSPSISSGVRVRREPAIPAGGG